MEETNYMETVGPAIPNEVAEAVEQVDTGKMTFDELKDTISKTLEKARYDGILIGYRTAATVLMQMIDPWHQPNCSKREYERIFKRIEEFFGKALKKSNKELFNPSETAQN